jgi:hypothetical protein
MWSHDSSASIVTLCGLDAWDSIPSRGKVFLSTVSRPAASMMCPQKKKISVE